MRKKMIYCKNAERKNVEHMKCRKFQDVVMKWIIILNKRYNNKTNIFSARADTTTEGKVTR
jgi:hypothetical protein